MPEKRVTFATAFYPIQSKFPSQKYMEWTAQLFSLVRQFYLVVFTDEATQNNLLEMSRNNPHIRIVVRPWSKFHGMKYGEYWVQNHRSETQFNIGASWKLNLLWNEKVWMVSDVVQHLYFPETEYYGWVDIGYFRNGPDNIHTSVLGEWAHSNRLVDYSPDRVHYAMVNPLGFRLLQDLRKQGGNIPVNKTTVAGGFFFGGKEAVLRWRDIYTTKLEKYVSTGAFIRDDQIVVADCLLDLAGELITLHEGGQHCCCFGCQNAKMVDAVYRQDLLLNSINGSPFPLGCCLTAGINDWFLFQRLL